MAEAKAIGLAAAAVLLWSGCQLTAVVEVAHGEAETAEEEAVVVVVAGEMEGVEVVEAAAAAEDARKAVRVNSA